MAPIDIELEDLSSSSGGAADDGDDGSDDDNPPPPSYIPCPPINSVCTLTCSATLRLGDSFELEKGQCNYYSDEGWNIQECYVEFLHEGDENWEFDYWEFAFIWQVTATRSYLYRKGVARPSLPNTYTEFVNDGNGLFLKNWAVTSDNCFPNGGDPLTCSDSPPPLSDEPPPPPPDDTPPSPNVKKQVKIKVLYGQKTIWSQTGEPPLDYEVSCSKGECAPGFMRLGANNSQGFCCIKCDELRQELSTIKSLLRQNNG